MTDNKEMVPKDYRVLLSLAHAQAMLSPDRRRMVWVYGPAKIDVAQSIEVVKMGLAELGGEDKAVVPITVFNSTGQMLPRHLMSGMSYPIGELKKALQAGKIRPDFVFLVENEMQRVFSMVGRNLLAKATKMNIDATFVRTWSDVDLVVSRLRT